jgi:hypothetical protein
MHEDKQASIFYHLTSRSPTMMDELRKLSELIDTNNIVIFCARYTRSATNVWVERFRCETNRDDWQLNPRIFTYMDSLWGPHSIDRFATHGNTQLPCYNAHWRETQPPWTDSIYPRDSRTRRPSGATPLGRSFPTSSESYANLAPEQLSSRHTSPPSNCTNY